MAADITTMIERFELLLGSGFSAMSMAEITPSKTDGVAIALCLRVPIDALYIPHLLRYAILQTGVDICGQ